MKYSTNATQTCEPAATTDTTEPPVEELSSKKVKVFNNATQTCEPADNRYN